MSTAEGVNLLPLCGSPTSRCHVWPRMRLSDKKQKCKLNKTNMNGRTPVSSPVGRRSRWMTDKKQKALLPRETAGPSAPLRSGRDDNSVAEWALSGEILDLKRICHPDRSVPGFPTTQHSPTATCAALRKESRMKFTEATTVNRKSGGA